jgi:ABC-2 type transport system permease protein
VSERRGAVLRAEWTKARTVSSTLWLLTGAVAATVAVGGAVAAATTCASAGCGADPAKVSLTGVYVGQVAVAVLAVLAVSDEYATGMIKVTFAAMPRRIQVLAAKATILTGLVLVAGAVAVLGSMLTGRLLLPGNGFTASNGYLSLSLSSGPMLRAAVGSVLYLALIALLSLGLATAVREAAVAIGLVLALLFLFPIVIAFVSNTDLKRHLEQIAPMTAGMAIQDTVNLASQPIGPWAGLGVLAAWAGGALLLGVLTLLRRDA